MSFIDRFYGFLNSLFSRILGRPLGTSGMLMLEEPKDEIVSVQDGEVIEDTAKEEKINVERRTLMTRLYAVEQEITIFENDFPKEFQDFSNRIEELRQLYSSSLDAVSKELTFEIDPEIDGNRIGQVVKLEKEVQRFIESKVKFNIISKRLQRLIKKLNILYNVSIFNYKDYEKEKVISQLKNALTSAKMVAQEFKGCDYILSDTQLKERIISLISYSDYQILKAYIRNSVKDPREVIPNLTMMTEFEKFDYVSDFVAFIKDELSDLVELLPLISDLGCRMEMMSKSNQLFGTFTYCEGEDVIIDRAFWYAYFDFESTLLEMLRSNGVTNHYAKVRLITRMDINVNDDEVLVTPMTKTHISLISLFTKTHDERIVLLIKLLKNVSKDITYKEVYFLLQVFDAIELVANTPNDIFKYIKKYLEEYPYTRHEVMAKKRLVKNIPNKEYVVAFKLDDYTKEIISTLENINIDFQVVGDLLYINSFYFNEMPVVRKSLQDNTTTM